VLWTNEKLNEKVSNYVQQNAAVKSRPNLTAYKLCEWIDEELLTNVTLEPGFPRKIPAETARQWWHKLGFEVLTAKKAAL